MMWAGVPAGTVPYAGALPVHSIRLPGRVTPRDAARGVVTTGDALAARVSVADALVGTVAATDEGDSE